MMNTPSRSVTHAAAALVSAALLLVAACQNGSSGASKKPAPASSLSKGTRGADKAEQHYTVSVEAPKPGKVGSALVATVKLVPSSGYKVNLEYPTKLIVRSAAAATPEQTLTAKDAAEMSVARALFKPSVTLKSAGTHDVKAELKFSVCTKSLCELKRATLTWRAQAQSEKK